MASFYYPPVAEQNCNDCHMPAEPSEDFGSKLRDGVLTIEGLKAKLVKVERDALVFEIGGNERRVPLGK